MTCWLFFFSFFLGIFGNCKCNFTYNILNPYAQRVIYGQILHFAWGKSLRQRALFDCISLLKSLYRHYIVVKNPLVFQASTTKNLSFMDSNEKKTKLALQSCKLTFLVSEKYFHTIIFFFFLTLSCHKSKAVKDVDLIPRARPKYQLTFGTKCSDKLPLCLSDQDFLS